VAIHMQALRILRAWAARPHRPGGACLLPLAATAPTSTASPDPTAVRNPPLSSRLQPDLATRRASVNSSGLGEVPFVLRLLSVGTASSHQAMRRRLEPLVAATARPALRSAGHPYRPGWKVTVAGVGSPRGSRHGCGRQPSSCCPPRLEPTSAPFLDLIAGHRSMTLGSDVGRSFGGSGTGSRSIRWLPSIPIPTVAKSKPNRNTAPLAYALASLSPFALPLLGR
jgi:hypothetical protein